jgi:uncharacterized protein (TIRG00374 family)
MTTPRGRRATLRAIGSLVLLTLVTGYLWETVSLSEVAGRLSQLRAFDVGALLGLGVVLLLLRAWRWKWLLRRHGGDQLALQQFLFPMLAAQPLNLVVPGKGGELLRFYFMRGKIDDAMSVASVVVERAIDLICLLALACMGLVFVEAPVLLAVVVAGLLVIAAAAAIALTPELVATLDKQLPLLNRPKVKQLAQQFADFIADLRRNPTTLVPFVLLGFVQWGLAMLQCYLMLSLLSEGTTFAFVTSRVPIGILATLIPVTIGGLGSRETAFLILFAGSVAAEATIAFTTLFFLVRQVWPAVLGAPVLVLLRPTSGKNEAD